MKPETHHAPAVKPAKCECEHEAHFDRDARTPCGNPAHNYGVMFYQLRAIPTAYGTLHVCPDCAKDCHGD